MILKKMFVLNGNGRRVLDVLRKLGFSPYEARAYFTLVLCGQMKAGNVARMSGVPQSRVYAILQSLEDKNVVRVRDGIPKAYETSSPLKRIVRSYVKSAK